MTTDVVPSTVKSKGQPFPSLALYCVYKYILQCVLEVYRVLTETKSCCSRCYTEARWEMISNHRYQVLRQTRWTKKERGESNRGENDLPAVTGGNKRPGISCNRDILPLYRLCQKLSVLTREESTAHLLFKKISLWCNCRLSFDGKHEEAALSLHYSSASFCNVQSFRQ